MIKVWTGVSGTGKSEKMFADIDEKTNDDPLGNRIYIITPTQNTLTYEQVLTNDNSKTYRGSLRTNVLSFSRFMWHIFNEIGHREKNRLSDVGHIMLIHKILQQFNNDELTYYRDSREYVKFSGKLLETIEEFINYDISVEDIKSLSFDNNRTKEKYDDLVKVYEKWLETIDEYSIENINLMPHFLNILNEVDVNEIESLNNATIYVDGFHNFSELELQLLKTLTRFTDDITLLLMHSSDNKELFRKTENVIQELKRVDLFGENGVDIIEFPHENYRAKSEGLYQVENYLRKGTPINNIDGVSLIEAPNMRAEIEEVMRQIETLIRTKNVKYKDIGILYRDQSYIEVLRYYFEKFDIEYSIDQKYKMIQHPFIQFVMSIFEAYRQNFKRESIINIMKSGYLNDNDDFNMYVFENVVLESGIDFQAGLLNDELFKKFLETRDDGQKQTLSEVEIQDIEKMLAYKNRVLDALNHLFKSIESGTKAIDYIQSIYQFLEKNRVLERLEKDIDTCEDETRKNETEDAYNHFINLLDNAHIVYGEDEVTFELFVDNLIEGLMEAEFNLLPATLDEVTVGVLDLAKVENKKYIFMVGMNHANMPMEIGGSDIISDEEKRKFEAHELQISPTNEVLRRDERFVFYHGVTRPTDGLFMSYSLSNLKNEPTKISPFVKELVVQSKNMKIIRPSLFGTTNVEGNISSINSMEDLLLERLRDILNTPKKYEDTITEGVRDRVFLEAMHVLQKDTKYKDLYDRFIRNLAYKNESEKVDEAIAESLYGEALSGSVSRFHSFYNCQFQHFMRYGLKLHPREEFKLEAVDIGNLYHTVLEDVMKYQFNYDLKNQSIADINSAVSKAVRKAVKNISYGIFEHSGYYQALMVKAIETITDVVINLQRYSKASDFDIKFIEERFGRDEDTFGAYRLHTTNDHTVHLRGVIDRVDVNEREDGTFISLIDYKSSDRKLDLTDVYLGTELQQFMYMNVIEENSKQMFGNVLPLTMMFYTVKSTKTSLDQKDEEKLLKAKTKEEYQAMLQKMKEDKLKPSGLFVVNEDDASYLDATTDDTLSMLLHNDENVGDFYKGFTAKGKINKRSKNNFISIDMYNRFKEHAVEKIKEAADDIYDGQVRINPISENDDLIPCRFCEFKSSCNIDYIMNKKDFVDKKDPLLVQMVEALKEGGESVE